MNIKQFEDIIAWQKSRKLTRLIYIIFKDNNDYGFKNQIERASVSIMNNIAEGFERKGDKEFSRFLFISKGSCGEVRSMLYLAKDLSYIDNNNYENCIQLAEEISKILSGFIKKLR